MTTINELQVELDQLREKREELMINIDRVTHHIEEEMALNDDGPDQDWIVRARHARRKMKQELGSVKQAIHWRTQELQEAKAAEKRKKQEAIDAVRERIFIDKAREMLPKEIYFDIWRQVDAEQPQ